MLDIYYGSYLRARPYTIDKPDRETRTIAHTQALWDMLGIAPWDDFPCITVAGSKGKGSTATLLASILSASGEKVGLITSPHLLSFRERIRIDGQSIAPEQLDAALDRVEPAVLELASRIDPPQYLGPAGILLALAMPFFRAAGVSVCVVEAGRGGEFDEARLVRAQVSVITPIMLEHTKFLGATREAIAETKARITYPGSPLIVAPQDMSVRSTFVRVAAELRSPIQWVQDQLTVRHVYDDLAAMVCDIQVGDVDLAALEIGLHGYHQIENAATAITAAQALRPLSIAVTEESIRVGLRRARVPGRFQQVSQQPLVIVDGAINAESAHQACSYFRHYPCARRIAVIAVPSGKDLDGVCREVAPLVDTLIVTEVPSVRLTWNADARHIAECYHTNVHVRIPAEDAFNYALSLAGANDGILILGTQTFVANALHYWQTDASLLC